MPDGPDSSVVVVVPWTEMTPLAVRAAEQIEFATSTLARIEKIEVHQRIKRQGHNSYVLDVFLHRDERHSQPAKNAIFQRAPSPRVSDYQVDHGYREFAYIRRLFRFLTGYHGTKDAGRSSIGGGQCEYCARLQAYLIREWWLPSAGVRMTTTGNVKMRTLETFINRLLDLVASENAIAGASSSCRACVQAPMLLEQFLRRPRSDELGII